MEITVVRQRTAVWPAKVKRQAIFSEPAVFILGVKVVGPFADSAFVNAGVGRRNGRPRGNATFA